MKDKNSFRIRVYEIPKGEAEMFSYLDDGYHLDRLAFPEVHGFTLVEDREEGLLPVAITVFSLQDDCLSIEWFYVSDEHRGLGYGERLLYECFKAAEREQKGRVQLLLTYEMLHMSDYLSDIGFSPIGSSYEWIFNGNLIPDEMPASDVPQDNCVSIDTLSDKDKSRIIEELSQKTGGAVYNADSRWGGENEAGCIIKDGDKVSGMIRFVKLNNTWLCTMAAAEDREEAESMLIFSMDKFLDKLKPGEDICFTGIDMRFSSALWDLISKNEEKVLYIFGASTEIIGG